MCCNLHVHPLQPNSHDANADTSTHHAFDSSNTSMHPSSPSSPKPMLWYNTKRTAPTTSNLSNNVLRKHLPTPAPLHLSNSGIATRRTPNIQQKRFDPPLCIYSRAASYRPLCIDPATLPYRPLCVDPATPLCIDATMAPCLPPCMDSTAAPYHPRCTNPIDAPNTRTAYTNVTATLPSPVHSSSSGTLTHPSAVIKQLLPDCTLQKDWYN